MSDVGEKRENRDGESQPSRKRKKVRDRVAPVDPSPRAHPRPSASPKPPPPPSADTPSARADTATPIPADALWDPFSPRQGGGDPRPGAAARREIDNACANGDIDAAFAAFDAAVAAGDPLQPHSCNVLLHLCAGGTHTSEKGAYPADAQENGSPDRPPPRVAVPSRDAVFPERANAVFNYMVENDVQRTEMTYTALARVEAAAGQPRRSFDVALRSASERLRPKMRTFAPALHAFCAGGDVRGASEVEAAVEGHGLELTEDEFAALVDARAESGDWDAGVATLRRAADAFRVFGDVLANACARFFQKRPGWALCDSVEVNDATGAGEAVVSRDEDGNPRSVVAMQLRAIHLSAADRASLLAGIGKLSRERESADHFEGFVRWLKRRGPLPFLVDGANAGMYNQNFQNSGFNFDQVEKVMRRLRAPARAARDERVAATRATSEASVEKKDDRGAPPSAPSAEGADSIEKTERTERGPVDADDSATATKTKPDSPSPAPLTDADVLAACASSPGASSPVVFLHVRRVRGGPANAARARECLDGWKRGGELFTTPAGSNDDWYWLYAAVASGDDAFLVSNDEMRDHAFQMLPAPALFRKWKERHQVRFHMSKGSGLELFFPPAFSHCAQNATDDAWWMIPKDDGSWLCAVKSERETA